MENFILSKNLLLVGTGYMGQEYGKVLKKMLFSSNNLTVVGRGSHNSKKFNQLFGYKVIEGGLSNYSETPDHAIISVDHRNLFDVSSEIILRGCKSLLVEKPGGMNLLELNTLNELAKKNNANIYIGFNRRFFSSVQHAKKLIESDGGLISTHFDFTEMETRVIGDNTHNHCKDVLNHWGIFNSFHVIDLFIHFAGAPSKYNYYRNGKLNWHPNASNFAGSGVTEKNVLFSYLATWSGAGRWGLELTTRNRKIIMCPLEKLIYQSTGNFELTEYVIDIEPNEIDTKPGLFKQVQEFLSKSSSGVNGTLCTLTECIRNFEICESILGYKR